jgi:hypothetical protein
MEPSTKLHVQIIMSKIMLLKKKHRHIVETARSLLLSASIPNEFWGEVVLTVVS